jgi:hypothetical protein
MDKKNEIRFDKLFAIHPTYIFRTLNTIGPQYIKYQMRNGDLFYEYGYTLNDLHPNSTIYKKIIDFSSEDCKYILEYYLSLQK